jgi:hypothetical protein
MLCHSSTGRKVIELRSAPMRAAFVVVLRRLLCHRARGATSQRKNMLFVRGLLALALFGVAAAGPLEEGEAAYQRGDYATALQVLRPLADQGTPRAEEKIGEMYRYGEGVPPANRRPTHGSARLLAILVRWPTKAMQMHKLTSHTCTSSVTACGRTTSWR